MNTKSEKKTKKKLLSSSLKERLANRIRWESFLRRLLFFRTRVSLALSATLKNRFHFVSGYSCPTTFRKIPAVSLENKQSRGPLPSCQPREEWRTSQKHGEASFDLPRLLPPGRIALKKSPSPSPNDWTCPGECPGGGMVTGKIEPCINKIGYKLKWL